VISSAEHKTPAQQASRQLLKGFPQLLSRFYHQNKPQIFPPERSQNPLYSVSIDISISQRSHQILRSLSPSRMPFAWLESATPANYGEPSKGTAINQWHELHNRSTSLVLNHWGGITAPMLARH